MNWEEIYVVSIGSIFAIFLGWQLAAETTNLRHRAAALLGKHVFQTLLVNRQSGTADFSVGATIAAATLVGLNVAACAVNVSSQAELGQRLSLISVINLVPLLFGGRTSFVVDRIFGLSLQRHGAMHRWLGRLCLIEAAAHACVQLSLQGWTFSIISVVFLCTVGLLLLTSFLYVRRILFEIFLKLHPTLALTLLLLLWIHIDKRANLETICLGVGSLLWAIQTIFGISQLAYRNLGGLKNSKSYIKHFGENGSVADVVMLDIEVRRPWYVRHGEYVYITLPSMPDSMLSSIQSHPYLIAWSDQEAPESKQTITLLIECHKGFSSRLRLLKEGTIDGRNVLIDGPYGHGPPLAQFDKVLFVANGVGIAAHLIAIRHLLESHNDQTARVRRVTLLWFLERPDHETWAREFIEALMDLDLRRVFLVYIYTSEQTLSSTAPRVAKPDLKYERILRLNAPLDVKWVADSEWEAEAGDMALSVCGTPAFEQHVRRSLRKSSHDIHLFTSPFQMDETQVSRDAAYRYASLP